ncbi:hypothetical protein GJAV_G00212160 [Gymnothorax javanicus]|nr:hypothetical protein GJAV_G00212160 [Gymnothorax javanicus]
MTRVVQARGRIVSCSSLAESAMTGCHKQRKQLLKTCVLTCPCIAAPAGPAVIVKHSISLAHPTFCIGDPQEHRGSDVRREDCGKPVMASDGVGTLGSEQPHLTVSVPDCGGWVSSINSLGLVPVDMNGQPLVSGFDPSLGLIAPINGVMPGISLTPAPPVHPELPVVKEIIHCESCTLFPQNPNVPPPSTRERPPGCKTVFVGGLPENASEDVIREVFEPCGDIIALRMSKKNFCHIRFSQEYMVDKALYLSGYRMRIGTSTDKKDSGRIHVDFAQARDDLYEWECRQRMLAREERRRRLIQEEHLRPPSPPPIMHYSEHEGSLLAERLKDDSQFSEASAVLLTWIDRGEVTRRTANHFYTMLQSTNGHVRRLLNEKAQQEEELELARERFRNAMMAILTQFEQIAAVFNASAKQKAWDHFSKAQRRNIDMWRKQCEELRNAHSEEILGTRREEEMEMSDDESNEIACKKTRVEDSDIGPLQEQNGGLRWQLDSYRAQLEVLKQEQSRAGRQEELGQEQLLHSVQEQLQRLREELRSRELELQEARQESRSLQRELVALREKGPNGYSALLWGNRERLGDTEGVQGPVQSEKEALLLGIISTFLHVHPFGANIEYLWSYIQRLDSKVSAGELEQIMGRLPRMFRQELSGVGASLEKRWKFCGFDGLQSA